MLKHFRRFLAILSIIAVTLLFVDFTGTAASLWGWMAKIQFMPALLAVNAAVIVALIAATLIFGRLYCSVICPLGIYQDAIKWLRDKFGPKKTRRFRFKYVPAHTCRHIILLVFVVLLVLGFTHLLFAAIAGLIEPYSAYGRIASQIFAPGVDGVNNALAAWSESMDDNYWFYRVTVAVSVPVLIVAIATLALVTVMAWRGGRDYCNTICPVGTILGYLSRFSVLRPVIDTSKCVNCTKCARRCKAKCIDARAHQIDYSRCVVCFDCINECAEGAISYTRRRPAQKHTLPTSAPDRGRRGFVAGTGFVLGALAIDAVAKTTDGGFTPLKQKQTPRRDTPVVPAGAESLAHLGAHCTACQLCIQNCPSGIIRPSTRLDRLMQPELDFTLGYCDPLCTTCSDLCPVGAFHPVAVDEKSSIKIGQAVVDLKTCLSASEGEKCGKCATVCPASAIKMEPVAEGSDRLMPIVLEDVCIGCGACENHCPVGTVASMRSSTAAIHVEGLETHRLI